MAILAQTGGNRALAPFLSKQPQALDKQIDALAAAVGRREYKTSIPAGQRLLKVALLSSDARREIRVRRLLGGALLGSNHYPEALRVLLPARTLAIKHHDFFNLYRINNNVGWIYLEMNNLDQAAEFADEALEASRSLGKYDPAPVILRGFIFAKSGDLPNAESHFLDAITHAVDQGDLTSAASAWHLLGVSYFEAHQLDKAEAADTEAFRLRELHHLTDLDQSLRDLARVLAYEGDLRDATVLMDRALATMGDPKSTAPVWYFFQARGELRMMQGDLKRSLKDLRMALDLARRLDVVPTDDDRVTFESGLAELYSLFINVGNRLYLKNHDEELKAEIFEAAEANRATSLRAIVPQPHGWRTRLPLDYTEALARLQQAERSILVQESPEEESKIRLLRATLNEAELRAGAGGEVGNISALTKVRSALDSNTAFLAFHLGQQGAWVWAVTDKRFDLYELPSSQELSMEALGFSNSIQERMPSARLGEELGKKLLGRLPAAIHEKHRWILALDQDLFELPLGALLWNGHYLAEEHSLLLTPSISLMAAGPSRSPIQGRLVGLGDAIYNFADPRWKGSDRWFSNPKIPEFCRLARLSGSGKEVRTAVAAWGNGATLTGAEVTRATLWRTLQNPPAILHLATHVIKSPGKDRSGMIVLGLNSQYQPDLLDMRDILLRPANVSLVVMSGCASGDAVALPASGLMGLTRAWLGAGAQEVLATRWPSLDDNGPFFRSFYTNLRRNPNMGAAEALHLTQQEMIRSQSFRSSPDYWATYFLIGKA